ncbi:kinase-like domain-containing protein [Xylariaceae sp. FL1272]|nr:kinase-like domain-containing protein [Xylariaceae sp. FL1272]
MHHQEKLQYTVLQPGAVIEFANHKLVCIETLGQGGFGIVYKVQDTGPSRKYYALKTRKPYPTKKKEREKWLGAQKYAVRELNFLQKHTHPHIINILPAIQDNDVRFLMPLCETNVEKLVDSCPEMWAPMQKQRLLRQMLQALDYLVSGDPGFSYIHRDLKPENILLRMGSTLKEPHFILADFGCCHDTIGEKKPGTWIGTEGWMAPEIAVDDGLAQTPKVDVWSLFLTVQWCHSEEFRTLMGGRSRRLIRWLKTIMDYVDEYGKKDPFIYCLRMMSIWPANLRASAAQMLLHLFNGDGLTTPVDQVDPLDPTIYQQWRSKNPKNESDIEPLSPSFLTKEPPANKALANDASNQGPHNFNRDPRLRQHPLRRESINDLNMSILNPDTQSVESSRPSSGSIYVPSEISKQSGNTDSGSRTICADQVTVRVQKKTAIRRQGYDHTQAREAHSTILAGSTPQRNKHNIDDDTDMKDTIVVGRPKRARHGY